MNLYSTLLQTLYHQSTQIWPVHNNGITLFYLSPTHEPHLPLPPAARRDCPLAGVHCAYPQRDGQAESTWVACHIPRQMLLMSNFLRISHTKNH